TAACATRSASASEGSHLRLTASGVAASWERANIFPATLNTEVLGPNGKVSAAPANEKQYSRSSAGFIVSVVELRATRSPTDSSGRRAVLNASRAQARRR